MTDFISRFFDWLAEPTPAPPPPSERRFKELDGIQNSNRADDWKRYDEAYRRYEAQKAHHRSLSHRLRIRANGGELWPNASIREPHPFLGGTSTVDLLNEAAAEIDRLTDALERAKNAPP